MFHKSVQLISFALLIVITFHTVSCNSQEDQTSSLSPEDVASKDLAIPTNPERTLLWGDTHLHTSYSSDALLFGTLSATPGDAYRFARGEVMTHPATKQKVQLQRPLDFLVVADHAEGLGLYQAAKNGNKEILKTQEGKDIAALFNSKSIKESYTKWVQWKRTDKGKITSLDTSTVAKSIWHEYINFAERFNDPGKFTALIGWEWTAVPDGYTQHRVVFSPDAASKFQNFSPFSSANSEDPEDLWHWLDATSKERDLRFIAIPHNSNISGGLMFPEERNFKGDLLNKEYAQLRSRWETVAEITQIKGTSEVSPQLSPSDEFANFELWDILMKTATGKAEKAVVDKNNFLRYALINGMKLESELGVNPYKVGFIGSTDAHTGMSGVEENNFQGKFYIDGTTKDKSKEVILTVKAMDFSASGYAAVWAESNTRDHIYEAFKRREVYGSTGPRIQLRVFGGYDFDKADMNATDYVSRGYQKGVPMGSDLMALDSEQKPSLMIHAAKDPSGANLDRIQVIKGTYNNGVLEEQIYEVAWSGARILDSDGKLSKLESTVDTKVAQYDNSIGAASLATIWEDPDYNPNSRTYYYVRVLEIPTPRYSTYASSALEQDAWKGAYPVMQERAYSSPIWVKGIGQ